MKEIMAVIRINKVNETKRALSKAGITSFTGTGRVQGRGKGIVDYRVLEGAKEGYAEAIEQLGMGPRLVSKRLLTIVVNDDRVKTVIDTIICTNQTGNAGDGKIFVLPVIDSLRVRTGEHGEKVLDFE